MATKQEIKEELKFVKHEISYETDRLSKNYQYLDGYIDALNFCLNKNED